MAAKVCVVTAAGLALLAAGPLPLTLTKIAIGSVSWTPTDAATALNTQIKQINITDATTVAANIIHVAVTDTSADVYSCREIGLYVGTTLFAIYSQATPLFDKAAEALGLFATDIVLTSVAPGAITVGAAGFSYPQATETLKGVAEIATQTEANAGTDDSRIVTPLKAKVLIAAAIAGVRNGVSASLDTLIEISASLGYDSNFSGTMTTALSGKANTTGTYSGLSVGYATNANSAALVGNAFVGATVSSAGVILPAGGTWMGIWVGGGNGFTTSQNSFTASGGSTLGAGYVTVWLFAVKVG